MGILDLSGRGALVVVVDLHDAGQREPLARELHQLAEQEPRADEGRQRGVLVPLLEALGGELRAVQVPLDHGRALDQHVFTVRRLVENAHPFACAAERDFRKQPAFSRKIAPAFVGKRDQRTFGRRPDHLPMVAVTGEETSWDDVVKRVSVVRHAKDAQRMYNYWNSSMVEVLALQPKQPFIGTHRQFAANLKDWANVGRSNSPCIAYTPDPSAPPPQRNAPAMASPGMLQAMSVSVDDIKATTGIYDAALGNSSNETSGRAILARQQESDVSTFFIADNLDAAVQQAGKIIVELIPHIYDTPRTLLVRQEDGSEEMVKVNQVNPEEGENAINDLRAGLYDVDVSTGPSFATKRMEAAQSLLEFAQIAPEARPVMMDLIAKNMDWPGADEIASRLRKVLPPGIAESDEGEMTPEAQMRQQMAAQQAQLQQQMAALEMQETAAKIEKTQSEAAQNRVETASDALELAVQSGQLQQVVSAMVQQQLAALVAQNTTAPAPGLGV